jgi:probable HAF family extracellular repeat protein
MVSLGALDREVVLPASGATSINDAGQVVGWSTCWDPKLRRRRYRPFLYTDATGMINLWPLITNPPPGVTEDGLGRAVDKIMNPASGYTFGRITAAMNGMFYILTPDR